MQIKLFTIPTLESESANEEMNKFLRSHQVIGLQQEFVPDKNGAYWCFSIKYIQGENTNSFPSKKEKIDYREVLDQSTFKIFSKLRECRKEIAKNDAVPAYAVITDAELSAIAKLSEISLEKIKTIKGIGTKKLEKYGKQILEMYQKDETSRKYDI